MIKWSIAKVMAPLATRPGIQELAVQMSHGSLDKAIVYTDEHGMLLEGDIVLLNTTAMNLKLGTGGYHYVHAVLKSSARNKWTEDSSDMDPLGLNSSDMDKLGLNSSDMDKLDQEGLGTVQLGPEHSDMGKPSEEVLGAAEERLQGHLMKLRYTSLQRAVLAAEEAVSPYHDIFAVKRSLEGMPVLIGELHSMLPIVMCWLKQRQAHRSNISLKIAYIMTDGGALPLAFSRHVAELNQLGWLTGTITYGHAYGGDIETLNKFTGLLAAKHILQADITIVAMGPGIAGTGTPYGHSGMEVGEIANAVHSLGGVPLLIPRISFKEQRERHYGLSHHVLSALEICYGQAQLPLPRNLPTHQISYLKHQLNQKYVGVQVNHSINRVHVNSSENKAQLNQPSEEAQVKVKWIETPNPDEIQQALSAYPVEITTMGRGLQADSAFFRGVCAAAEAAWQLLCNK